jgi:hypothetical protein
MGKRSNTKKKNIIAEGKKPKQKKKMRLSMPGKIGSGIRKTLDGSLLVERGVFKHLPFIFFIMFWAVMFIANGYNAEKKIRKIDELNRTLDELRFEHIATKSELMNYSRLSQIATKLKHTGLEVSTEPPYKIFAHKE